ncbi:MAG: hypothetical protein JWR56_1777 [Massilia sp.]|jgi:hypothetical protein|nr:hypothetical protein [Massilia sp.]
MNQRTDTMNFKRIRALAPLSALAAALSGCATLTDSTQQEMLVRAVVEDREVSGVACLLSNDAGRWFVVAPGRVTIQKSVEDLRIDCKKDGVGTASGVVASRFGAANMIGNAVASAGLGYFVDRYSGAGFDYPLVLMVVLRRAPSAPAPAGAASGAPTPVY